MEIVRINETELKVTLTADDMEHYAIDCAHMDYGTTETRRAFWSILDEARQKTGFDAARDRIYIRVYPSVDGGCDMYVTKLSCEQEELPEKPSSHRAKADATGQKTEKEKNNRILYALDITQPQALLELCRILQIRGYAASSDAYVMHAESDARRFFLAVAEDRPSVGVIAPTAILDEYGTRIASPAMLSSLAEHAVCIAHGNAVDALAALA